MKSTVHLYTMHSPTQSTWNVHIRYWSIVVYRCMAVAPTVSWGWRESGRLCLSNGIRSHDSCPGGRSCVSSGHTWLWLPITTTSYFNQVTIRYQLQNYWWDNMISVYYNSIMCLAFCTGDHFRSLFGEEAGWAQAVCFSLFCSPHTLLLRSPMLY